MFLNFINNDPNCYPEIPKTTQIFSRVLFFFGKTLNFAKIFFKLKTQRENRLNEVAI